MMWAVWQRPEWKTSSCQWVHTYFTNLILCWMTDQFSVTVLVRNNIRLRWMVEVVDCLLYQTPYTYTYNYTGIHGVMDTQTVDLGDTTISSRINHYNISTTRLENGCNLLPNSYTGTTTLKDNHIIGIHFSLFCVPDYAQYIAQVANLQLGEGLPDGTTVTFIDPSALENAHVLDPNTLEIQSAIQIPTSVNIEHVILEPPILEQLSGLQTSMGPVIASGGDTLSFATAVEGLPMTSVIETVPVDIKPPVGKVSVWKVWWSLCN